MSCGNKGHHGGCQCGQHHGCGCGGHSPHSRAFWTKGEKIAWLEEHLDGLREEVKAVEERIAKLKAE